MRLMKKILIAVFATAVLVVATATTAQADHRGWYRHGHGHYYQYHRPHYLRYHSPHYHGHHYRHHDHHWHGRHHGYLHYRGHHGGSVRIGPLQFYWH